MPVKFRLLYSGLMSLVLSFLMTAWVTYINLGLVDEFTAKWMAAFITAWPAAGVISFVFAPALQRLSTWLLR